MTSKEAKVHIIDTINGDMVKEYFINEILPEIEKDLDRLEKLEKVIKFLKLNFNVSLDSKLRISDDSECVQTVITCLPENTTIDEMFKVLKEVLENE